MPELFTLDREVWDRTMLNLTEFHDSVILDASVKQPTLWIERIKRGAYELGQGIVRQKHRFYGDVVDQSGLTNWSPIQVGREAAGQDPGYDACQYEAEMLEHGMETLEFTGYGANKRTPNYCIRDFRFNWEWEQQLKLILGFVGSVKRQMWENMGREGYLYFVGQNSNLYVMAEGSPNGTPLASTYNPFTSSDVVITRDINVSALEWSFFEWWHQYLALMARGGMIGGTADDPKFGLVMHPYDFYIMLKQDPDTREDLRYANAQVNIDGYGKVKEWKGYGIIQDMVAPRFNPKAGGIAASTQTLQRVNPFLKETTNIGKKPIFNPDYLNAQYGMAILFLDNVYMEKVPVMTPASIAGAQFGVQPSLMGDAFWLNIQHETKNPLREKGFYFLRNEAFLEPLENDEFAIAVIYKRCPQIKLRLCEPCEDTTAAGTWVTILSATALPDTDEGETTTSYTKVQITLSGCLPCEVPAEISVDYDGTGGEDVAAVLVSEVAASTYILEFDTAAEWITGGVVVANTTKIVCK